MFYTNVKISYIYIKLKFIKKNINFNKVNSAEHN